MLELKNVRVECVVNLYVRPVAVRPLRQRREGFINSSLAAMCQGHTSRVRARARARKRACLYPCSWEAQVGKSTVRGLAQGAFRPGVVGGGGVVVQDKMADSEGTDSHRGGGACALRCNQSTVSEQARPHSLPVPR